jgi:excisionase family DNA binding protein
MSNSADQLLKLAVKAIIEETRADSSAPIVAPSETLDAQTKEQIAQYALLCHKPYLTRKEVAVYLSVSERSISEWTARASDRNPFPESAAGGEPRFKREHIDEWAAREAQRRRLKLAS